MEELRIIQLEQERNSLVRLFEPWKTAPHGTAIWDPEDLDPNAAFKRAMIDKASEVIAAADKALAGASFEVPKFGQLEHDEIERTLADDSEQRAFFELAAACERVVQSLARAAA